MNVLVTGASRGIGRAIAERFAKEGHNLVLNYSSSDRRAMELKGELEEKYGVRVEVYKADVKDFAATKEMVDFTVKSLGSIDVLVNNSGITRDNLIIRMDEDSFDEVIGVNLKGTFNCIKHASRYMIKGGFGRIINISSVAGRLGNFGQSNYASSKAGVIGLTKTVAKELGKKNITVNAVAPGFIETDMTDVLRDDIKEQIIASIPVNRIGKPEEIADAVYFLSREESGYITGQTLSVDGGMCML